jgi:hypothetical protein
MGYRWVRFYSTLKKVSNDIWLHIYNKLDMATTVRSLHFTVTGEFLTEHSRSLFVEDKPKKAVEFLKTALIGMPEDMAWEIVLGEKKVTGDSDEGCDVEEDSETELFSIPLSIESVWNRLARKYFSSLGELQMIQRRIMIFGNSDDSRGTLYRSCGYEGFRDYIISLEQDREVYLKRKEIFDEIVRQIIFVGLRINKTVADLPIVSFEVPTDYEGVNDRGFYEFFSFEYLLKSELSEIQLPDDARQIRYQEVVKDRPDYDVSSSRISALDSYLEAQREIDKTIEDGIKPTSITEPKSAGWIAPNGDYYGLDGDIANMLHSQLASALLESGIIEETDEMDKGNPDNILGRKGWVKVHGNWVLYEGYERVSLGEKEVPITDEQIHALYVYGQHMNGWLEFGFQRHRVSAVTIPDIDKLQYPLKYFKF